MTKDILLSRRQFLLNSSKVGISLPLAGLCLTGCVPTNIVAEVQRPPLALAMWDFSWLTRRDGDENEYADVDAILDAFVERGYNCIRLDAFPHLIAADQQGNIQSDFLIPPQKPYFMWGNHSEVSINPRRDLIHFMHACRDRKIRLGLSTWLQPDTTRRDQLVSTPQDMARVWIETLEWINNHGLLDIVEWVDMCNEFPIELWAEKAAEYINESLTNNVSQLNPSILPYTKPQANQVSDYMNETITLMKQAFPTQRYCFSFAAGHANNYCHFDFSTFDCFEPHIWLNQNKTFMFASGLLGTLLEIPEATEVIYPIAENLYYNARKNWLGWLDNAIESWAALANRYQIPLYTSESWGPINYQDLPDACDDKEWDWVFDVCEAGANMAKARGWTGICSSNFCQPHHKGFYDNIEWHQLVTGMIRA
jgi:hypothetical protein